MTNTSLRICTLPLILLLGLLFGCNQKGEKVDVETKAQADLGLDRIPEAVMGALMTKFPQAEIHKSTREKEGDIVLYDIQFKQGGRKFEADIKEDGTIHNWEKEITAEDLPEAVKMAVETKYPDAAIKEIMEITAVTGGQDALEGYEIVFETADETEVEVTVAPNGEILEDSGEEY